MAGSGGVKSKSGKTYKANSPQGMAIKAGARTRTEKRVARGRASIGVERSVAGAKQRLRVM